MKQTNTSARPRYRTGSLVNIKFTVQQRDIAEVNNSKFKLVAPYSYSLWYRIDLYRKVSRRCERRWLRLPVLALSRTGKTFGRFRSPRNRACRPPELSVVVRPYRSNRTLQTRRRNANWYRSETSPARDKYWKTRKRLRSLKNDYTHVSRRV